MTFVAEDLDPSGLERKSPTEAADIDEIRRGMLAIQAQAAAAGQRPLARGTHAKGICVKAELEVLDVRQVVHDPALAERLARGIFSTPGIYPAIVRFANADGGHRRDRLPDVRAMSFSIDVPPGLVAWRHPPRFLDEQQEHVSDQRLACVRGIRPGALGRGDACEMEGAPITDVERIPQSAPRDSARPSADEGHAAEAVPAASLLEHRAVPPRRPRRHQVPRRSPQTIRRGRCRPARTGCRTSSCGTSTRTSR